MNDAATAQDCPGDALARDMGADSQKAPATRPERFCEFCAKAEHPGGGIFDFACLRCRARWFAWYGKRERAAGAAGFVKRGLDEAEIAEVRRMVQEMRSAT